MFEGVVAVQTDQPAGIGVADQALGAQAARQALEIGNGVGARAGHLCPGVGEEHGDAVAGSRVAGQVEAAAGDRFFASARLTDVSNVANIPQ